MLYQTLNLAPQQLGEFKSINLVVNKDGAEEKDIDPSRRRVWLYDFVSSSSTQQTSADTIPYNKAWDLQKRLMEEQLLRIGKRPKDPPLYDQFIPMDVNEENFDNKSMMGCDSIIMLQHDPVYTLGTASDTSFIHGYDDDNSDEESQIPIVRIERGGEVTYRKSFLNKRIVSLALLNHSQYEPSPDGPGQITVYPILDLRGYNQDVHWYMRALEESILLALENAGVKGGSREEDLTGVWVSNKKIAACGVKLKRWITMHGVAINIDIRSLENFDGIVPCGLEGRKVTCVNDEVVDKQYTLQEFAVYMKLALEEIFGITLIHVA